MIRQQGTLKRKLMADTYEELSSIIVYNRAPTPPQAYVIYRPAHFIRIYYKRKKERKKEFLF